MKEHLQQLRKFVVSQKNVKYLKEHVKTLNQKLDNATINYNQKKHDFIQYLVTQNVEL